MTHLSDFTFLARGTASFFVIVWAIIHMYTTDRFEALRWRTIKKKEVKSMMTVLFLLSAVLLLTYDIICTKIKYTEGYIVEPLTNTIISKPSLEWSPENKALRHVADRILMLVYALENSAVFLLQNLWSYLANKLSNSKFITTWQFRINYIFILITMIGFPCIPIFFSSDDDDKLEYTNVQELRDELRRHTYEEVVPELAAASCNLIVVIYGLMAHFKFSALIKRGAKNQISELLRYYQHMNLLLILIIGVSAAATVIFSIDGLTEEQYLNKHKFTADLIAGIMNFSVTSFSIVLLMIFYPHSRQINGGYSKLQSPSIPPATPTSPIPEPPNRKSIGIKHIQIKVDSTTTTTDNEIYNTYMNESYNDRNDYLSNYYSNNNEGYNRYNGYNGYNGYNLQNDQVQIPSPLVTNNRQIISYSGSPKQYY